MNGAGIQGLDSLLKKKSLSQKAAELTGQFRGKTFSGMRLVKKLKKSVKKQALELSKEIELEKKQKLDARQNGGIFSRLHGAFKNITRN